MRRLGIIGQSTQSARSLAGKCRSMRHRRHSWREVREPPYRATRAWVANREAPDAGEHSAPYAYSAAEFGVGSNGNPGRPVTLSLAFRLHLPGLLLHHRENRGDFFQVQIGRDLRVTSELDHGSLFSVLELVKDPLEGSSTNVVSQ
jgi:hypothetical protein